jgi:predicted CopG family antitoxin
MVTTTIQINSEVKNVLDKMKSSKENYEQLILKLIQANEKQKREQEALLIEGCKEMAEENLKIAKEFEAIEDLSDWEW